MATTEGPGVGNSSTARSAGGYGLTQGELDGDVLTCEWHNWKFRVTDGSCLLGDEAVPSHPVTVDKAGDLRVTITRPDPDVMRPRLLAHLRSERNATTRDRSPAMSFACSR